MKILLKAGDITNDEFRTWHEKAIKFPERKKSRIIKPRFAQVEPQPMKDPTDRPLVADDHSMTALQIGEENSATALELQDVEMSQMHDSKMKTIVYSSPVDKSEDLKASQKSVKVTASSRLSDAEEYKLNEIVPIDANSTRENFAKKTNPFQTA